MTIVTMICGHASWYAYRYLKKAASFHKVISWLMRKDRLAKAIRTGRLGKLFEELGRVMSKRLCKQKKGKLRVSFWRKEYHI
ncbi:hypothetical protein [Desulfonema magnum]|uniref:Uncharacterized protein n=1 Tax=Desulfonema magnum TaxID=45655 RepID=A0A975BW76_9BACT|nr:hypothetical protein [Desulfonema magnum]QTA92627.1 Uncharacterized protein dnm_087140 [Desulfonema magnum]